jgi:hypothetical protein
VVKIIANSVTIERGRSVMKVATLVLAVPGVAVAITFGYFGSEERAMNACVSTPPERPHLPASGVSVEIGFLPWKVTCVYSQDGIVVAKLPPP